VPFAARPPDGLQVMRMKMGMSLWRGRAKLRIPGCGCSDQAKRAYLTIATSHSRFLMRVRLQTRLRDIHSVKGQLSYAARLPPTYHCTVAHYVH
jgi:hypothetical protein